MAGDSSSDVGIADTGRSGPNYKAELSLGSEDELVYSLSGEFEGTVSMMPVAEVENEQLLGLTWYCICGYDIARHLPSFCRPPQ